MTTTYPTYWSTAELAQATGQTQRTIVRAIESEVLVAEDLRTPGRSRPRWRIADEHAKAYLERHAKLYGATESGAA